VLSARGFGSPEEARAFVSCGTDVLHDPFLLRDMDLAVARVKAAIGRGERVAVYGDYDVDGITATAMMVRVLRGLGFEAPAAYIPDRVEEGYGINSAALRTLRDEGVSLVITVDTGVTAIEEAEYARSVGLDLIITDHHECREKLPDAHAVVNPHRPDCPYPFKQLAGVGVAFKLACALSGADADEMLDLYGDLVCVGTVADVMPVTGENRAIVGYGLKKIAGDRSSGIYQLLKKAGAHDRRMSSTVISYSLAPRINAAGRMGRAKSALDMFLAEDGKSCEGAAELLCELNLTRQQAENTIMAEAEKLLRADDMQGAALVLAGRDWHQGVVGVVASRLADRYSKPVFLISLDDEGKGKGSARGVPGLNLCAAIEGCAELCTNYGGHELAAGFTLKPGVVGEFREHIEGYVSAHAAEITPRAACPVDAEADPWELTKRNVEDLSLLEPYGTGNPTPVFAMYGAVVTGVVPLGNGRHTRLEIDKDGIGFKTVYFGISPEALGVRAGDLIDVAFTPDINEFRGLSTVQLLIQSVRLSGGERECEAMDAYHRHLSGEKITPKEAKLLYPSREDFTAVWRFLKRCAPEGLVRDAGGPACRRALRESGIDAAGARTLFCLDVFVECGLLTYTWEGEQDLLEVKLAESADKADLGSSKLLRALEACLG